MYRRPHRTLAATAAPAEALEWSDVDLTHATVRIDKAVERSRNRAVDKGEVKPPKTTNALRTVPIDPALLPLLVAMHAEAKGEGRVFPIVPSETEVSRKLHVYLEAAGVKRASLFTPTDGTQAIVWYHATRSTGITWEAIRGLDGTKLMRRAGHAAFQTTLGNIREAENMTGATFGEVFPALPASLLGRGQNPPGPIGHRLGTGSSSSRKNQWAQQDLKGHRTATKRRQTPRTAATKRPAPRRLTATRMGRMTTQT